MGKIDSVARLLALSAGGNGGGSSVGIQVEIVDTLPTVGETGIIYLVPKTGTAQDTYDEYMYLSTGWEKIGSTDIDLTDYAKKQDAMMLTGTQTISGAKTFTVMPKSTAVPVANDDLSNKKYVDDAIANIDIPSNAVTTDTEQTISGAKTFSIIPKTSVTPTTNDDIVNKAYVDTVLTNYVTDVNAQLAQLTTPTA